MARPGENSFLIRLRFLISTRHTLAGGVEIREIDPFQRVKHSLGPLASSILQWQ